MEGRGGLLMLSLLGFTVAVLGVEVLVVVRPKLVELELGLSLLSY